MAKRLTAAGVLVAMACIGIWWATRDAADPPPLVEFSDLADDQQADDPATSGRERLRVKRPAPRIDAPESAAVRARLGEPFGRVAWDDRPLREILGEVAAQLDVPIHVQTDARAQLQSEEANVSMRMDFDVTGQQLLDLLTQFRGLAWEIADDRVVLRKQGAQPTTDETPTFAITPLADDQQPAPR